MDSTFCKKIVLIVSSLFFLSTIFANSSDNWVIAVANFESNIEDDPTAELIARTVLENIPVGTKRTVTEEEQLQAEKQTIEQEILELYNTLQKEIIERDSIIFSIADNEDFEKSIEEKQIEIDLIYSSIEQKKDEQNLLSLNNYVPVEKDIALWKNNDELLYIIPENTKSFNPKDIQALVTGSIKHIDNFLHVDVRLTLYPGNTVAFELSDAEKLVSVKNLSNRITEQMFIQYSNKENITINFAIQPPEAQENAILHINGNLVRKQAGEDFATLQLTNGIYDLYIESPGYQSVALTQYFGGEDIFDVDISLKEQFVADIDFSIPSINGDIFFNAQKAPDTKGTVTINTLPVLGEFIRDDGVSTWFILDAENSSANFNNAHLSFNPNKENPADIIEKKRKIMYHSYSALIASLPVYFILHGQHINEYNAWASGNGSGSSVKAWETAKNVSMGVSIGLGVNFLVQLGLYIYSVNTILPQEITIE